MRKKRIIRMSAYKVTSRIIASYILGAVSVTGLVTMCIYSAAKKGNAGIVAGIMPIILMMFNIAGLIMAYSEMKNDDVKPKHVFWGSAINGLLVILFLIIYISGIIIGI